MLIRTEITGIGDPFVLRKGKRYYMYATSSPKGFHCYSSEDLINWQDLGLCYENGAWGEKDFWAPEVFERGGKYYMFFTARWAKKHSLRIGVAVSNSPEGPFQDLTGEPLFDFGYAVIDATLFRDDDGKEYLYYVRDCSENMIGGVHTSEIYCAEIAPDYKSLLGEPVKLTTPDAPWETEHDANWRWNEGPAVLKHDGKYYMCYSVNCFDCADYSVGYAVASSPMGRFEKYEHNPILKKSAGFSGPGHNNFFTDENGKLYTSFHIHTDPNKPSGNRRACIAEAEFDEEGVLKIIL